MMSRAKDDFFKKPRRGIEHRQDVKPRANRSEDEARARYQNDKFAETPEAGDGEMQEIDPRQVVFDRVTEFAVGAAAGGVLGFAAAKLLGMAYGDAHGLLSSLALYGVVFGGGINAVFLHKAPK
jgi:hypothetical protein